MFAFPLLEENNSAFHPYFPLEFLFLSMNDSHLLEYPEMGIVGEEKSSKERHQC